MKAAAALAIVSTATVFVMSVGVSAIADDTVTPSPIATSSEMASADTTPSPSAGGSEQHESRSSKAAIPGPNVAVSTASQGGSIGTPEREGCNVAIPVATTGPGSYVLEVWDDGYLIDSFDWFAKNPGSTTITWRIPGVAGRISYRGVGFFLERGDATSVAPGQDLATRDYEYPDDIGGSCSTTAGDDRTF